MLFDRRGSKAREEPHLASSDKTLERGEGKGRRREKKERVGGGVLLVWVEMGW